MIRINLLAVDRATGGKKKSAAAAGVTTAQRLTIGAALILISTIVYVGYTYWSLHVESRQLDEEIARAEVEAQQLRSVLSQVQKYETEKARLQQRVTLIEQLRRGQTGPVHILDEVSKALPDRLWLVSMGQRDKDFTIEGRTTSLTVLSDCVATLEGSAWFTKPVEILDTAVDQTPNGDIVRFTVRATTQNPEGPVAPAAPAGRGAPPAR
jgi:type IV pilus assembly protein PilN